MPSVLFGTVLAIMKTMQDATAAAKKPKARFLKTSWALFSPMMANKGKSTIAQSQHTKRDNKTTASLLGLMARFLLSCQETKT